MAIYDFSKVDKRVGAAASEGQLPHAECAPAAQVRGQLFSAVAARFFFLLLLIADLLWMGYALIRLFIALVGIAVTNAKVGYLKESGERAWISLRRSLVCAVSLLVAVCSPAFGIMIACTYFLMYDKSGIEEVVPASLQSQFREFLPQDSQ